MKKITFLLLFCFAYTSSLAHSNELLDPIDRSISSVVFIANQYNSFDDYFQPSPDSNIEYLRPIYECLWPPIHFHGSGFIISSDGYVVTNAHVVEKVTQTFIALANHEIRVFKANLVGIDERTDIAVLKIEYDEENTFPFLTFGDSDQVKIGEDVAIIGNPLTSVLESTVTAGIISGRERRGFGYREIEEFLQTDAPINPGNSGGPMINEKGEVIGVISAGMRWFEGLNFVIPSQVVKKVVAQLIDHGEVSSGILGVTLKDESETIFDVYQFDRNHGAVIESVKDNSPAEQAGLQKGDCIIAIDDHPIKAAGLLLGQLALIPPYQYTELTYIRDGKELTVGLELAEKKMLMETDW